MRLGLPTNGKIILYVGNLIETKGLGELADAFSNLSRRYSELRLVVVGAGSFENEFRQKLDSAGTLSRVIFTGMIPADEVALWMNAADILCLPSYTEGCPNVVLEALACGTPVVASAVGGVPELAALDGRIALVSSKDLVALQEALDQELNRKEWPSKRFIPQTWSDIARHELSLLFG
jgi:glycosyltransferase involved in cell wall biosynthesis